MPRLDEYGEPLSEPQLNKFRQQDILNWRRGAGIPDQKDWNPEDPKVYSLILARNKMNEACQSLFWKKIDPVACETAKQVVKELEKAHPHLIKKL